MQFKTITDIEKEIARVQAAIDSTNNDFLRRDYVKYIKRLKIEKIKVRLKQWN